MISITLSRYEGTPHCCGFSALSLRRDATPHFPLSEFTPSILAFPEVNFTTTAPIRDLFFWRLLSSMPATPRYKAHLYTVNTYGVTGLAISNTGWPITPQPLPGFQIRFLEVIGLDASYTPV